jgi:hypothetical protein
VPILEPNILKVESGDEDLAKGQKKAAKEIFEQLVGLNKYINPVNSKTLEEMKKQTRKSGGLYFGDGNQVGKQISEADKQVQELYKEYVYQTSNDLIELTDK